MGKVSTVEGTSYAVTRDLCAHRDWLIARLAMPMEDEAQRDRLEADLGDTRRRIAPRKAALARSKARKGGR